MSQYARQLQHFAQKLVEELKRHRIMAAIDDASLREYSLKLRLVYQGADLGNAVLYYSPRKNSYRLVLQELTAHDHDETIAAAFDKLAGTDTPAAPTVQGYVAYVDGSYDNGRVGYGALILRDNVVAAELFGRVSDADESRQVAGELAAVQAVIRWCTANGVERISIYYDYTGIEHWALGRWQANTPLTRQYRRFMQSTPVEVLFHKVQSHSGNRWNDWADALARHGAAKGVGE